MVAAAIAVAVAAAIERPRSRRMRRCAVQGVLHRVPPDFGSYRWFSPFGCFVTVRAHSFTKATTLEDRNG